MKDLSPRNPPSDYVWTCEDCGETVEPKAYDLAGGTRYLRVAFCSCQAGQVKQAANDAALAEAERVEAERERQYTAITYLRNAKLDRGKYKTFRFGSWEVDRTDTNAAAVRDQVMAYALAVRKSGKNWMYLAGDYGLGKTHLAIAVAAMLAATKLWRPHVIVWPEICQLTKESWSVDNGPTEGQMWAAARNAGVLVIDDLDKLAATEWQMGLLFTLLNHRYEQEKPTIITANKSLADLENTWINSRAHMAQDAGVAVISRIAGQTLAFVEFTGDDQRMTI